MKPGAKNPSAFLLGKAWVILWWCLDSTFNVFLQLNFGLQLGVKESP